MEALRSLSLVPAKVLRDGALREIPADRLVPGDIVVLEAGDIVTADLRLVEAANLQLDESTLTGESAPVAKDTAPVPEDTPLHGRSGMAFKGTAVTSGSGAGVAVATGMESELGRIADLVSRAEPERSPLERRLDRLGGQLVWVTLALAAVIGVLGITAGRDILLMVTTAVALAVAAVPEGLPVVATMALARGMWRMAGRNALIEKLSAVETLGATTTVFVDKTGTLTENRMTVVRFLLAGRSVEVGRGADAAGPFAIDGVPVDPGEDTALGMALETGLLCNNAALTEGGNGEGAARGVGDPMELALLVAGRKAGLSRAELLERRPEVREEAFSTETRMMATVHREGGCFLLAVKGAPESVLACADKVMMEAGPAVLDDAAREDWHRRIEAAAGDGLRLIALAVKQTAQADAPPYEGLTLLGLAGLLDPLRPGVAEAVADCRGAGVNVVMLTGDHAATARKIASDVGLGVGETPQVIELRAAPRIEAISEQERARLMDAKVFARISPEVKLALVALHQQAGHIVAMTGDGVNDAPALKKADIGIAMGQRGTQVAREAAHMVLKDDSFASIVAAMRQGRIIFGNIRKFVLYLMSCNLAEIMIIGLATLSGLPLPLLPLQILYLNLVTDVFPAFALGVGEGDAGVMQRPPRDPKEAIVDRARWLWIGVYGASITVATLTAFVLALHWLKLGREDSVTVSFLTLALAQMWHVFNMADWRSRPFVNDVTRNPWIWAALGLSIALILMAVHVPALSSVLALSPPPPEGWALVIGASAAPLIGAGGINWLARLLRGDADREVLGTP
jgi:Ca2+-transporting ATPase